VQRNSDVTRSQKVRTIALVIKKHFRNLSTGKTIELAFDIMEALEDYPDKVDLGRENE